MDKKTVFSHIAHTILQPEATWEQVDRVCKEAVDNGFASACIPPRFVKKAKDKYGIRLEVCTVVGFPLGYNTTRVKVFEAQQAVLEGADEIDMVIHVGDAKAGDYDRITEEIREIKAAGGSRTREASEGYINQGCARVGASAALTAYADQ